MQLPFQLLSSLQGINGFNAEAFTAAHQDQAPVVSLRLNPGKPADLSSDWAVTPVPWCSDGRYLKARPSFTMDPLLHAGAYYVQEASSMFIWHILSALFPRDASLRAADICAAPGGKSTLLAAYFEQALVVANEVIRTRVPVLTENLVKWGSAHTIVTNNDPSHFRQLPEFFDLMLVDAPCSGSGLFRKDPTVIETWQPEQVELCNRRQQRILADVLPALREGGYLIYATCSFSPEEDEDITRWLIDEMDMEPVPIPVVADWGIVEGSTPGTFRFFPDKLQGEGFYASVLRKKRSDGYTPFREVLPEAVGQQMAQHFRSLFHLTTGDHLFFQSGAVRLIPQQHFQSLSQLAGSLYIKKAGVALGEQKGKDIVPSHEWAMLQGKKEGWPMVQVDREQALSFLARQTFELPLAKGWSLLTYKNSVLGWVKNAGSRLNNYYPADWRIRRLVNG